MGSINVLLYSDFCSDFCINLQSGEDDAGCPKLKAFHSFEMTDFIENCIKYDGNRLKIFLPSGYDSIQSEDMKHVWYFDSILEHTLCSFITHAAIRYMFLRDCAVFGMTWKW